MNTLKPRRKREQRHSRRPVANVQDEQRFRTPPSAPKNVVGKVPSCTSGLKLGPACRKLLEASRDAHDDVALCPERVLEDL